MPKQTISTPNAPAAIGPYSQAVRAGDLLFLSGQIPLDPVTGLLVEGTAAEQAFRVLENLKAVVEAAGATMEQVAKTTIYLADMNDFASVNEVYARYFPSDPPARATVQVSRLPKDVSVEIDAVVYLSPAACE